MPKVVSDLKFRSALEPAYLRSCIDSYRMPDSKDNQFQYTAALQRISKGNGALVLMISNHNSGVLLP